MPMPSQMPTSNMVSKLYCSGCGGFHLVKLHRGFIQKRILDAPNKLFCQKCEKVLSTKDFDKNIPKIMPAFIEEYVGDIPDDAKDTSEVAVEEIIVSEAKVPSLDISEFGTSSNELSPPKKRNQKLLWLSYASLFLIVGGLGYFGYQYMRGGSEVVFSSPALSARTLATPEKNVITEKAPEIQKSSAIEIVSIKPDSLGEGAGGVIAIENKELTTKPVEVNLGLNQKADTDSVEVVAGGTEIDVQDENLTNIRDSSDGQASIKTDSAESVESESSLVRTNVSEYEASKKVVDKQQDLITVPSLEVEIRIVLPFKDNATIKETVAPQLNMNQTSLSIASEKNLEADDAMLEKAAVELIKSDLDSLF